MTWKPQRYESFRDAREAPFQYLLHHIDARFPRHEPKTILDAGCGTGRTTRHLARRYNQAAVLGVDASTRMIGMAFGAPRVQYTVADLAAWSPKRQFDWVISNAVLHWISQPEKQVARHASWSNQILGIQVPDNFSRPSHQIVREVADQFGLQVAWGNHILRPQQYVDILTASGFEANAWRHEMVHHLDGDDAVYKWMMGTTMRPVLAACPKGDQPKLLAELQQRLGEAYAPEAGRVSFPFRRIYAVARRVDAM